MKKLQMNLENCYGIKRLNESIEFEKTNRQSGVKEKFNACLIYASNGTMKTSLANTFLDIENEHETIDRIEPEKNTIRDIKIDGKPIEKEDVLVIQTYIEGYDSKNKSKLLVSKKLKDEYDNILNEINRNKSIFLNELKKVSGINNISEIEKEIVNNFKENEKDFFEILRKIKKEYIVEENKILDGIKYKEVVNDDIEKALSQKVVSGALSDYMKKYNEILEESDLYKPGVFDNTRATITLKALKDNNFFKANHKVMLESNITLDEKQFENKMQEVEEKILSDEEIKKNFKIIEITLDKKAGLRKFKELLYNHQDIIPMLKNYNKFKKVLWLHYISKSVDIYNLLLNLYSINKGKIKRIIAEAKNESTIWKGVTDVFNDRFSVPFKIEVVNQEDVILKEDALILRFVYKAQGKEKNINRDTLEECLSNGEKKLFIY